MDFHHLKSLFRALSLVILISSSSILAQSFEKELDELDDLIASNPSTAKTVLAEMRVKIPREITIASLQLATLECMFHMAVSQYQVAADSVSSDLTFYEPLRSNKYYGDLFVCHGLSLEYLGNIAEARAKFDQAINFATAGNDTELLISAYRARGDLNAYNGTVESALSDLQKAYELAESLNDEQELMTTKNSLGILFAYIDDHEKAIPYYLDVYQYAKKNDIKADIAVLSFNLARIYQIIGQKDEAEKYFAESYQVSDLIGDEAGVAFAQRGIGQLALEKNNLESAERNLLKAIEAFTKMGDRMQVAQCRMFLASLYQKLGKNKESIQIYQLSLEEFKKNQSLLNLKDGYGMMADSYAAMGRFEDAFQAQKEFHQYHEKLFAEENNKRIADMRVTFDMERQQHENELLVEQNRFTKLALEKQTQIAKFQFWVLALAGLFVFTLLIQIWRYIRTKRTLEILARTDELTNLANRRHIMEFIEKDFLRAQRGNQNLALVMFDIDHFKQFNDRYGHKVGDRVLQSVAKSCLPLLRKSDILGRIGGEEFLLFLPQTDEDAAFAIAERCREAVSKIPTPLIGDTEKVTISSGVVAYHEMMESVDDMLNKADMALYQAKKLGRNKTCIAE